jgi:hypothetical protein
MEENNDKNFKVVHMTLTHEVDEPDPPPHDLKSKFGNLQEWLLSVCSANKPDKAIDTYRFGLFESLDDYTIFLVGLNTLQQEDHLITNIDFEPSNMYFRLPNTEFENLTRTEFLDKLTSQLTHFIKTEEFKRSFLAQAKSITTDFSGEIWPK